MEIENIYISREWLEANEGIKITSPYNGEKLAMIGKATEQQVKLAIKSAKSASIKMKTMTNLERADVLNQIAYLFAERSQEAAEIIVRESGKPIRYAIAEINRTIETYRFAAEESKRLVGEMIPLDAALTGINRIGYTIKEPLGVVAAITPFNFPQNLVAHKVAPAIAAGNPIILKPATQTALSALFLADIIDQTDLPIGGFNVVTGGGGDIGDILTKSDDIKMITFTGSTSVGKHILKNAGLKKVSLELGSNAGLIISKINDIEAVVNSCVTGAFSNQGQVCISLQRIYVIEELYDEFLHALKVKTESLNLGDPMSEETDVSSMVNPKEQERALDWIRESQEQGASLVSGGIIEDNILTPTILSNVEDDSKISCKEVFAPVVIVNKIKNVEEGVRKINNSIYGLQAGIFTTDISEAFYAQSHLEVGGVIINDIPTFRVDQMPYGGVKESGNTKEGLKYSIDEMTETKLIVWNNN